MQVKILIVDDEVDLKALLKQKFQKAIEAGEMVFHFAHNGEEALDILGLHEIQVALTDLNMPGMDGHALLKHLQARIPSPVTMVMSAYSDSDTLSFAMRRGAFDFLVKPLNLSKLEASFKDAAQEYERRLAYLKAWAHQ